MRHRRHRGNVSNCCVRSCPRSLSPSMPQSGRPRCEIIWHSGGCTALEMTLTKSGGHSEPPTRTPSSWCGGLAADYDDTTIALILSRQHRRTGTGAANCWPSRHGLSAILPRVPASCLPQVSRYDAAGSSAQRASGTRHRDLQNACRSPLSYTPPSAQTCRATSTRTF
jgi:hypothetical protein